MCFIDKSFGDTGVIIKRFMLIQRLHYRERTFVVVEPRVSFCNRDIDATPARQLVYELLKRYNDTQA